MANFNVKSWLKRLQVPKYISAFEEQGFTLQPICSYIDDDDLDALGVTLPGHRKLIKLASQELARSTQPITQGMSNPLSAQPGPSKSRANSANTPATKAPSRHKKLLDYIIEEASRNGTVIPEKLKNVRRCLNADGTKTGCHQYIIKSTANEKHTCSEEQRNHSFEDCPTFPHSFKDHPEAKERYSQLKVQEAEEEAQQRKEAIERGKQEKKERKEQLRLRAPPGWNKFVTAEYERLKALPIETGRQWQLLDIAQKRTQTWQLFIRHCIQHYRVETKQFEEEKKKRKAPMIEEVTSKPQAAKRARAAPEAVSAPEVIPVSNSPLSIREEMDNNFQDYMNMKMEDEDWRDDGDDIDDMEDDDEEEEMSRGRSHNKTLLNY